MISFLCALACSIERRKIETSTTTHNFGTATNGKRRYIIFFNPADLTIDDKAAPVTMISDDQDHRIKALRPPTWMEYEIFDVDDSDYVDFILNTWDVPLVNKLFNKTVTQHYVFVGPTKRTIYFDLLNPKNKNYDTRIKFTSNGKTDYTSSSYAFEAEKGQMGELTIQQVVNDPIQFTIQTIDLDQPIFEKDSYVFEKFYGDTSFNIYLNYSTGPFYGSHNEHTLSASRSGVTEGYRYSYVPGNPWEKGICQCNIGKKEREIAIPAKTLVIINRPYHSKNEITTYYKDANDKKHKIDKSVIWFKDSAYLGMKSNGKIPFVSLSSFSTDLWPSVGSYYFYLGSEIFTLKTLEDDVKVKTAESFVVASGVYGQQYISQINGNGAKLEMFSPYGKKINKETVGPIAYHVKFPSLSMNGSFGVTYDLSSLILFKEFSERTYTQEFMEIGTNTTTNQEGREPFTWKHYAVIAGIVVAVILIIVVIAVLCNRRKHDSSSGSYSSSRSSSYYSSS